MSQIKDQQKIPTTKVQRASKFISTGAKIGTNYLKHYSKRLVIPVFRKTNYMRTMRQTFITPSVN